MKSFPSPPSSTKRVRPVAPVLPRPQSGSSMRSTVLMSLLLSDGRTVCDFRFQRAKPEEGNFAFEPPNVQFALDADEPKFVRMLTEILGRTA